MSRRSIWFGALLSASLGVECGSRRAVPLTAGPGEDGGHTGEECPPGLVKCDDRCVNLSADQLNCGACNISCASWCDGLYVQHPCEEGTCVSPCPFGTTSCCDRCVDLATDSENCGSCGARCDATSGFSCRDGSCSCPAGLTDCSGRCVDLASDPASCGSCGVACSSGCWNGQCALAHGCSYYSWNGHTYAKCTSPKPWREASRHCRSLGAHLVTLSSAAEDAFVFSFTSQADGVDYWTGFNDIEAEGTWEWDSGEPVTYVGFAAGEPNNADVAPEGEDCASWYLSGAGWNDNSCDLPWPFVCEWRSPSPRKTFINPTVDGRNIEWGAGGGFDPQAPHAFCRLFGFDHAVSWQCCGGKCGSEQECHFTDCEKWYLSGAWSDGNCDSLSYDVFTSIVCEALPNATAWYSWQSVGVGDCTAGDVGYSWGATPLPSRCTAATLGQTAVCWDVVTYDNKEERSGQVWCTYKGTPTVSCWGGLNPGFMYTCAGSTP